MRWKIGKRVQSGNRVVDVRRSLIKGEAPPMGASCLFSTDCRNSRGGVVS